MKNAVILPYYKAFQQALGQIYPKNQIFIMAHTRNRVFSLTALYEGLLYVCFRKKALATLVRKLFLGITLYFCILRLNIRLKNRYPQGIPVFMQIFHLIYLKAFYQADF